MAENDTSRTYTYVHTHQHFGAVIAARTPVAPSLDHGPTLLFVGRPNESPGDMKVIRSIKVPVTRLMSGNATKKAVIEGLQEHRLAHFACPGHREKDKPFDTALELDCGERLALLDIVRCRVPTAEAAVLSSGRTAELVDGADALKGCTLLRQCSITDLEALLGGCGASETSPWLL